MAEGKTVLVLDDSPSIRQVVRLTLSRAGYLIVEAADGVQALEKLGTEHVDLIVSDLNMPKMDGLTFIARLRELPEGKFIPVIMLTTESDDDKKLVAKNLGVQAWFVKPFEPEKLVSIVKRLIG